MLWYQSFPRKKLMALAFCSLAGMAAPAAAKTLEEGAVPVNFPPASFQGRTFVDNDGCVYVRAGVSGSTNWVPRVSRDRRVICGQRPSFASASAPATPAPRSVAPTPAPRRIAAAPAAPSRARTGLSIDLPPIPEGYRQVWEDGRLNPLRGVPANAVEARRNAQMAAAARAGQGVSATRTGAPVAEQLANMIDASKPLTPVAAPNPSGVRFSTKMPDAAEKTLGRIEVASFTDMDAAKATARDFLRAGLPTRIGTYSRLGAARQVVLLGPFATLADQNAALAATRDAGFAGARLRN